MNFYHRSAAKPCLILILLMLHSYYEIDAIYVYIYIYITLLSYYTERSALRIMSISMVYGEFYWVLLVLYHKRVSAHWFASGKESRLYYSTLPLRFPSDKWIPRCKTAKHPNMKNHPLTALRAVHTAGQQGSVKHTRTFTLSRNATAQWSVEFFRKCT